MKIISLFNNKGGVGKTTLAFHLSCALAEQNHKVLMIDLDPQCNLSLCAIDEEKLKETWEIEDDFIDDFDNTKKKIGELEFNRINNNSRTIHYILKPTEQGTGELVNLPPPLSIRSNLDLIPGRLTLHKYEYKISERWSGAYQGDPLAIRTVTRIRTIASEYSEKYGYEYVIVDTSPSLGALNKIIISTTDGFIIPCLPDMFSLYGIRNIGEALNMWKKELDIIYDLISDEKRKSFPKKFIRFLGYTIYNARRYEGKTKWNLAVAHDNYAQQIPLTIEKYISKELRSHLSDDMIKEPIGSTSVMHSHSTLVAMSQKYRSPIWEIPGLRDLDKGDKSTISGNRLRYEDTKQAYIDFTEDVKTRIRTIED